MLYLRLHEFNRKKCLWEEQVEDESERKACEVIFFDTTFLQNAWEDMQNSYKDIQNITTVRNISIFKILQP